MSRWWTIGLCIAAAIIALQVFYQLASWTSRGGQSSPLYSSYRHDPYGTAALYDLLSRRGVEVDRVLRPRLDPEHKGTLIQVLPRGAQDEPGASAAVGGASPLVNWMHEGHTVIQFTRRHTNLMREVGVPEGVPQAGAGALEREQREGTAPDTFEAQHWQPARVGLETGGELRVRLPTHFENEGDARWRPIAGSGDRVVAAEQKVGAGRLIVVGAPTPALNDGLLRGDNVEIVLEWIGEGPVLFDEWSLGVGQHRTMLSLIRRAGLLPVIVQVLLAVGMYHWSTRRRGEPRDPPTPRRRSSVEQVQTLGYLYSQSLSESEVRRRVVAEVRARLAGALRCEPSRMPQRIGRLPEAEAAKVRQLLQDLDEGVTHRNGTHGLQACAAILDRSHSIVKAIQK